MINVKNSRSHIAESISIIRLVRFTLAALLLLVWGAQDSAQILQADTASDIPHLVIPAVTFSGSLDWLHVDGNQIVNESGEVVVLRGANVENREWSWSSTHSIAYELEAIPKLTGDPADGGWGANVVVLAVASGPINRDEQDYLDALDELIALAKANGAYTFRAYRYDEPNVEQPST